MAVPLIDKGVAVVAVGYDIAPKGRVFSFTTELLHEDQLGMSDLCCRLSYYLFG